MQSPTCLHDLLVSTLCTEGLDGSRWVAEVNGWIAIVPAHGHGEFPRSIT
ncbi:hypothetical protein AB0L65_13535 [Nonomuraea sp. NPDC052116]